MSFFSEDVKLKAQSVLKPYLSDDCPPHIRNPILLLNYLHQHAIIPSPNYFVVSLQTHLQHAVACKIGDLQMIGNGTTNKMAKTNVAQKFLDLLLKPVNISYVHNTSHCVTSVAYSTSDIYTSVPFDNERNVSKICLSSLSSSLNAEYQINDCFSNGVNNSTPATCLVEPQSSSDEIVQIHFQSNVFPENIAMDTSNTRNRVSVSKLQITPTRKRVKRKSNRNSDRLSKGTFQKSSCPIVHQQLNIDDFFNPFYKPNMSKTQSKVSLSTVENASLLPMKQSLGMNTSFTMASEQPYCDDFFDPFHKQRPLNWNTASRVETKNIEDHIIQNHTEQSNHTDKTKNTEDGIIQNQISQSNHADNTKNTEDLIVQNQANQSDYTENLPNVMGSKNVFALLQKKTQKQLKLIPRFRIESAESGFQCNVRIGSYHASGEGRNKKEAKTKAAANILNQMKDLN